MAFRSPATSSTLAAAAKRNTAETGKIDTPPPKLARKAPQVEIGLGADRMTTGSTAPPLAAPAVPPPPGAPAYNVGAAAPNARRC